MADSARAVIKGVIARLKAVTAVTDIVGQRIYTEVPQTTSFPYIRVGITSEPFAASDFSDMQHTLRIQCFSKTDDVSECLLTRTEVYNVLDRQEGNITLDAGNLVKCEFSGLADAFLENDGMIWQGVIEFDLIVN